MAHFHIKPFSSAIIFFLYTCTCLPAAAQSSSKVSVGYSINIETYFIAERLAIEHIDHYVFSNKNTDFSHQPMVTEAFQHFKPYANSPLILSISAVLEKLRSIMSDNAPILEFLLYNKPFPQKGYRVPFTTISLFDVKNKPEVLNMLKDLTDSLRQFYVQADVANFLQQHHAFYTGALKEVNKDINRRVFPFIESYYGERFLRYEIYIAPIMPITPGEDNYRGIGPTLVSPAGKVSTMVISTSRMLSKKPVMAGYDSFGFSNPIVTRFLTVHEVGHSFVNPHILAMDPQQIEKDSMLFTPKLKKALATSSIGDWSVCVIEHLVRLGEIRIAVAMKDTAEASRLRNMHIGEMHFVLLPLLEQKIKMYETNRKKFPDFNSFLPELMKFFDTLTPEKIDSLLKG